MTFKFCKKCSAFRQHISNDYMTELIYCEVCGV